MVAIPVPDDLAGLERMQRTRVRLAEGPVHRFIAEQAGILDVLAYITVAEQPVLGPTVRTLLQDAAQRRRDAGSVLLQSLLIEQAISRVWALRMTSGRRGEETS
jgi:hypothetical protein